MADMYEKLLGLGDESAAQAPPPDDPYARALQAQGQLPERYEAMGSAPGSLAAPYRPAAFPEQAPAGVALGGPGTPAPAEAPPGEPPSQESGVWSTVGRGLYGMGTGALAGILGMPGNLIQGMPWTRLERAPKELPPGVHGPPALGPLRRVTHYIDPLPRSETIQHGIDWLAQKTGLYTPPVPGTAEATAERLGKTFGEVVGPSKAIPGMSVGKLQDIWVGIQSLIGEEAARALSGGKTPEELEQSGQIGKGVAPMLWALGYGLLSKGLQRSGRYNLPKQVELPAAEKKVGEATTGLETTTEEYAARLKALQDKNRLLEADQERTIVPLAAAQEAEQAKVAAAQAQAGQTTAQAENKMALATDMADEQARLAAGEVKTIPELESQAVAPVKPVVEALNPTPGVREPGAEIQQALLKQSEAEIAARQAGHTALADKWATDIGPKLEDAALIDLTKADVRPQFLKQRKVAGDAFNEVEASLKGQKVVEIPGTRTALGRLVTEAEASNGSVAQEYLDLAELGLSPAQKANLKGSGIERAKQALQLVPEEKLEFAAARDIEERFYAAGGGKPLGTLQQAPPRYLKRALQEDMRTFFNTDAGTGAGPAMQLAKEGWNKFLTEYDRGIMTQLTDPRAGYQAQNFLKFLKNTSRAQIPELEAVLRNVSPETRTAISAHVAADMVQKATDTVAGVISPVAMKRQVQRLQKNGTFGILFDETQQKQLLDAVHEMTAKDTSLLPKFRKLLEGKDPEAVVPFIFDPGKVTRTEQYQMIAPEQFPLARQAWARKFLQDYETGGASAVQKQLTQMLREDNGVSQLAVMFPEHEFPGVVDQFKTVAAELRAAPGRAQATSERAERLREGAGETKRIGKEAVALTSEAGERTVASAQERLNAATQNVTDAQEKLEAMRAKGTAREGRQKESQALALKRASDEKKAAEKALNEVQERVKKLGKEALPYRIASHLVGSGGGTFAFLYGMTHSTPLAPYMLATGAASMALDTARWAMPAFARTQRGQRLMRDGLRQQYGNGAARWVHQVFVNTPEQAQPPEGEPSDVPTP